MSEHTRAPIRVREDVLRVPAYRQGAIPTKPGYKLSSNENPFDPVPSVIEALAGAHDLNRYAGAAMPELRETLAARFGVDAAHVHLAAGSVAILYQLVHAVAGSGDAYLYAWPSFEAYPALGLASGATAQVVPLNERAEHDLEAMVRAITPETRVIFLCTPNNPTGTTITREAFARFMAQVPRDTLVVLDEAYREFVTADDAVRGEDVIHQHPNLVVLRTFSKAYGLAGLRIGYGIGHPEIWAAAQTTAIPLSVTGIADVAARAALEPAAEAEALARVTEITERRDRLAAGLRELGLFVPEAQGNFVWIPQGDVDGTGGIDTDQLAADFADEGTLVRPFPGRGVRISAGEAESIPVVIDRVRRSLPGGANTDRIHTDPIEGVA